MKKSIQTPEHAQCCFPLLLKPHSKNTLQFGQSPSSLEESTSIHPHIENCLLIKPAFEPGMTIENELPWLAEFPQSQYECVKVSVIQPKYSLQPAPLWRGLVDIIVKKHCRFNEKSHSEGLNGDGVKVGGSIEYSDQTLRNDFGGETAKECKFIGGHWKPEQSNDTWKTIRGIL